MGSIDENIKEDEAEDRDVILQINATREELERLWGAGAAFATLFAFSLIKVRRHDRQIAQMRNWARATTQYLEQREPLDGFVNTLAQNIATKQTGV